MSLGSKECLNSNESKKLIYRKFRTSMDRISEKTASFKLKLETR